LNGDSVKTEQIHTAEEVMEGDYTVSGTVTSEDGSALENVIITVQDGESTFTDVDGFYSFDVVEGTHTWSFEKEGYGSVTEAMSVHTNLFNHDIELKVKGGDIRFLLPFFAIFLVLLLGFLMTGKGGE